MPLSDSERRQLREALHTMNNALNSISMQAELAKLHAEQDDSKLIQEALETIMAQCRKCSEVSRGAQDLLHGDPGKGGDE